MSPAAFLLSISSALLSPIPEDIHCLEKCLAQEYPLILPDVRENLLK